jgi:hypothetical protein
LRARRRECVAASSGFEHRPHRIRTDLDAARGEGPPRSCRSARRAMLRGAWRLGPPSVTMFFGCETDDGSHTRSGAIRRVRRCSSSTPCPRPQQRGRVESLGAGGRRLLVGAEQVFEPTRAFRQVAPGEPEEAERPGEDYSHGDTRRRRCRPRRRRHAHKPLQRTTLADSRDGPAKSTHSVSASRRLRRRRSKLHLRRRRSRRKTCTSMRPGARRQARAARFSGRRGL